MEKYAMTKAIDDKVLEEVVDMMTCDDCGRLIESDEESYTTADGRTICDDCIAEYSYCEDCNEWISNSDIYPVYDCYGDIVRYVCEDCLRWYPQCVECGRHFDDADILRGSRCEECCGDLIGAYHSHNPIGLELHGEYDYMSYLQGYIGWELELFGDAYEIAQNVHDVTDFSHCHFEEDCSVDIEIIGQPRTLENIHENEAIFIAMFDAINSSYARAQDGAGLHIHVSRTAFGTTPEERADRIAKCLCLFSENTFDKMARIAGRTTTEINDWCRCITGTKEDIKQLAKSQGSRYSAINLTNSDTVEFRLGKSTTDYDTFMQWIEFIAYIVKRSESITIEDADSFDAWMWSAPAHIRDLIREAGIELNEPPTKMTTTELRQTIFSLANKIDRLNHTNRNIVEALNGISNPLPTIDDILTSVGLSQGQIRGLRL